MYTVHNVLSASMVSRSTTIKTSRKYGNNAIAHAAYCRRETLYDERTGQRFDGLKMGKGQPAEWKDIFIPEKAPEWMRDPSKLWNSLEQREDRSKRRDSALLSRTFIATFDRNLNAGQREWQAKDMMREMARKGWVVDGVIHGADADNNNWHAHFHMPMRWVDEKGWGQRRKLGNNREERNAELLHWKERWSELGARQLRRAAHDQNRPELEEQAERWKYGHLTLKEQRKEAIKRRDFTFADECDREPGVHLGPAAHAMERRGINTTLGNRNREVQKRNHLKKLARRQGVSPARQIDRELTRQVRQIARVGKAADRAVLGLGGKGEKPSRGLAKGFAKGVMGGLQSLASPVDPETHRLTQDKEKERLEHEAKWSKQSWSGPDRER